MKSVILHIDAEDVEVFEDEGKKVITLNYEIPEGGIRIAATAIRNLTEKLMADTLKLGQYTLFTNPDQPLFRVLDVQIDSVRTHLKYLFPAPGDTSHFLIFHNSENRIQVQRGDDGGKRLEELYPRMDGDAVLKVPNTTDL